MKTRDITRMDSLKAVKIIALISALIFLITFWIAPKTNCDKCSFDLNGKNISAEKLMGGYYEECINHPLAQSFPSSPQNQTEDNSQ